MTPLSTCSLRFTPAGELALIPSTDPARSADLDALRLFFWDDSEAEVETG